jgi:hypothetical protein
MVSYKNYFFKGGLLVLQRQKIKVVKLVEEIIKHFECGVHKAKENNED